MIRKVLQFALAAIFASVSILSNVGPAAAAPDDPGDVSPLGVVVGEWGTHIYWNEIDSTGEQVKVKLIAENDSDEAITAEVTVEIPEMGLTHTFDPFTIPAQDKKHRSWAWEVSDLPAAPYKPWTHVTMCVGDECQTSRQQIVDRRAESGGNITTRTYVGLCWVDSTFKIDPDYRAEIKVGDGEWEFIADGWADFNETVRFDTTPWGFPEGFGVDAVLRISAEWDGKAPLVEEHPIPARMLECAPDPEASLSASADCFNDPAITVTSDDGGVVDYEFTATSEDGTHVVEVVGSREIAAGTVNIDDLAWGEALDRFGEYGFTYWASFSGDFGSHAEDFGSLSQVCRVPGEPVLDVSVDCVSYGYTLDTEVAGTLFLTATATRLAGTVTVETQEITIAVGDPDRSFGWDLDEFGLYAYGVEGRFDGQFGAHASDEASGSEVCRVAEDFRVSAEVDCAGGSVSGFAEDSATLVVEGENVYGEPLAFRSDVVGQFDLPITWDYPPDFGDYVAVLTATLVYDGEVVALDVAEFDGPCGTPVEAPVQCEPLWDEMSRNNDDTYSVAAEGFTSVGEYSGVRLIMSWAPEGWQRTMVWTASTSTQYGEVFINPLTGYWSLDLRVPGPEDAKASIEVRDHEGIWRKFDQCSFEMEVERKTWIEIVVYGLRNWFCTLGFDPSLIFSFFNVGQLRADDVYFWWVPCYEDSQTGKEYCGRDLVTIVGQNRVGIFGEMVTLWPQRADNLPQPEWHDFVEATIVYEPDREDGSGVFEGWGVEIGSLASLFFGWGQADFIVTDLVPPGARFYTRAGVDWTNTPEDTEHPCARMRGHKVWRYRAVDCDAACSVLAQAEVDGTWSSPAIEAALVEYESQVDPEGMWWRGNPYHLAGYHPKKEDLLGVINPYTTGSYYSDLSGQWEYEASKVFDPWGLTGTVMHGVCDAMPQWQVPDGYTLCAGGSAGVAPGSYITRSVNMHGAALPEEFYAPEQIGELIFRQVDAPETERLALVEAQVDAEGRIVSEMKPGVALLHAGRFYVSAADAERLVEAGAEVVVEDESNPDGVHRHTDWHIPAESEPVAGDEVTGDHGDHPNPDIVVVTASGSMELFELLD